MSQMLCSLRGSNKVGKHFCKDRDEKEACNKNGFWNHSNTTNTKFNSHNRTLFLSPNFLVQQLINDRSRNDGKVDDKRETQKPQNFCEKKNDSSFQKFRLKIFSE